MKKNIHVVGAIIAKEGKVFCCQRSLEKSLPGKWEFPGGKIEEDETPREALERELVEELRIKVAVAKTYFEQTSYEYNFGQVNLTTFLCTLTNGTPQLTEHTAIQWLKPSELASLKWAPADIPAVEKLMRQMSQDAKR